MSTLLWCFAVVSAYCAGDMAVRSALQIQHWRRLQASRNIKSQARHDAASHGIWLFACFVLFLVATVACGLFATFGVER